MNAQRIDDRAQERESPVRHEHAVQASRHGRASAPGYLGLPADEVPASVGDVTEPEDAEPDEADRAPRRSAGRARGRDASASDGADEADEDRADEDSDSDDENGEDATAAARGERATRAHGSKQRTTGSASKRRTASSTSKRTTGSVSKRTGPSKRTSPSTSKRTSPSTSKRTSPSTSKRTAGSTPKRPPTGRSAKAAATSVTSKVASAGSSAEKAVGKGARKEIAHVGGSLLKRALIAGSRRGAQALAGAGSHAFENLLENVHRLPIQQSIDVAVPLEIAWEQWMELEHLPEGSHRLSQVEREGDELNGRIDGALAGDWSAEVIDERERESFAWRSTEGGDSAGLATFHSLSDRLTRIELTLDVRPEGLGEAARLLFHVADRRVADELRRFKADAELLNPDVYEELLAGDGEDGDNEAAGEEG